MNILLDNQRKVVNRELPLHCKSFHLIICYLFSKLLYIYIYIFDFFIYFLVSNESFSYFGSILSYLIVAMPIFAGTFDDKDPSELSEIISKVKYTHIYILYFYYITHL